MTLTVTAEKAPGIWGDYAPDLEDSIIATNAMPDVKALEIREPREVETLETRLASAA